MHDSLISHGSTFLHADGADVAFHCDTTDDSYVVRLTPSPNDHDLYLYGSLDELAKFVDDLAAVVRELTERELGAIA